MIEKKINHNCLCSFLNNLRKEDYEELAVIKSFNFVDEILNVSENPINQTYFLTSDNDKPLAMGGACLIEIDEYKIAKVWLLSTSEIEFYKKDLYKYVLEKLEILKTKYDILFNFIYKSNFSSLKWLKRAGFKVFDLDNSDYKLFYFLKGDINFDIRYFTC
ncbi:MAG: DUF2833 domain-containing protein [Cyanobacteria bacterium SIG27]|nr:DUF2833 domain-containing protein [Cyanobacteria bacterium SIG27]